MYCWEDRYSSYSFQVCPLSTKLPNMLHKRAYLINDVPGSRGNTVKQKQKLDPREHRPISSSLQPVWKLRGTYFQVSSAKPGRHPGTVSLSPAFPVRIDCCLRQMEEGCAATTTPTADVGYRHNRIIGQAKHGHKTTWE